MTADVVIKGTSHHHRLASGWRILATSLIRGVLLAVLELWQALAAEAGVSAKKQTIHEIPAARGTPGFRA
jgi:hypothetical protein